LQSFKSIQIHEFPLIARENEVKTEQQLTNWHWQRLCRIKSQIGRCCGNIQGLRLGYRQ